MSYGQPPPQDQPPYGAPQYVAPPTSSRATTSLILGIASLVMCGFLLGIPAMIVARGAKKEIAASNGGVGGEGLATAGFVTGLIGTVWSGLAFLLVVGVFLFGGAISSNFEQSCSTVPDQNDSSTVDCS